MIKRFFRHLFTTTASGRRVFPPAALKAIQAMIAKGETQHRAEVRLMVEPGLPLWDIVERVSCRQRARALFSEFRIWDTEENSGVLIYVNLADHRVEIIADRGINKLVDAAQWERVCRTMTAGFASGVYQQSVVDALEQLNAILQERLPFTGANPNELSNRPLVL